LAEQRREVLLNKGSEPITQCGTNTGSDPKPIFSVKNILSWESAQYLGSS